MSISRFLRPDTVVAVAGVAAGTAWLADAAGEGRFGSRVAAGARGADETGAGAEVPDASTDGTVATAAVSAGAGALLASAVGADGGGGTAGSSPEESMRTSATGVRLWF